MRYPTAMAKVATSPKKEAKQRSTASKTDEEICDSEWCEIRGSKIHGRGLFATKDIPAGTRVIEYVGEKITKAESDRRGWAQLDKAKATGEAGVYIFTLNKRHDIDGDVPWNAARLINHSCETNCESEIIRGKIWILATREIKKDEELYFNYGFDLENFEDHPCLCGSERCVGFIAGEEYWKKLKKKLEKLREKAEKPKAEKGKKDKKKKGKK